MTPSPQQKPGASNPATHLTGARVYGQDAAGIAVLVNEVRQLVQSGVPPTEIGIVCPNETCGLAVVQNLRQEELPVSMHGAGPLAAQPITRQLVQLLHYLQAESHLAGSGDELLFEVLHGPWWGIAATDLAHLTMQAAELRYRKGTTLRRYLLDKMEEQPTDLFWQPLPGPLRAAMEALEKLLAAVAVCPPQQLVEQAVQEAGLTAYVRQQTDGSRQQIDALRNYVSHWQQQHSGTGLGALLHHLNTLLRNGEILSAGSTSTPGGVQVLPAGGYQGQPFLHLFSAQPLPEAAVSAHTGLEHPGPPTIARLDDAYEARAVQAFQMNVSALNNYLRCPLHFFYHNIVRIPSPRNEAMAFGSAVHHALEVLFRRAQAEGSFPPEDALVAAFTQFMQTNRGLFTTEGYTQRLNHGHTVLRNYHRHYTGTWNPIVVVERNIRGVDLDGIPLKGKLDKIEFDGKKATIVDYKSGNVAYARKQLQRPAEHHLHGGDYWRQAVFYKLLVEGVAGRDWQVNGVVFDFIEPDEHGAYCREQVQVTPADEATVKAQIRTVWEKVQRHDFYTGCGQPTCHWCAFVRMNQLDARQR